MKMHKVVHTAALTVSLVVLYCFSFSFLPKYIISNRIFADSNEQRAVWLQDDNDLDNKLAKLKNAHFNAVYFGVWGATHLGLQGVIDKVHAHGMDFHLWEANAFICAGQWLSGCSNLNNSTWYSRLPNGMSRKDLYGTDNYVDFGVPAVRQNAINYMLNYATNYNVDGINFDYIRYDNYGSWSFTQDNLDNFQEQFGVAPGIIRGDSFPAFSGKFNANRVANPSSATVLAYFQDSAPAIMVNDYKNGHVLTFNFDVYHIPVKVMDTVLGRAISSYGSSNIYVLKSPGINDSSDGPYTFTNNWLTYLGYTTHILNISSLGSEPAGSLLIAPGVYSYTDAQITSLDNHLNNGGSIIFMDGPVTSVVNSATFRNIIGASSTALYLPDKGLITVSSSAQSNPFVTGLTGATPITYDQASTYIDYWNLFMENTVTSVVKGVSDAVRSSAPNVKISADVFTVQSNNGNLIVHQDWPSWLRLGYLDYAVPMGYTLDSATFNSNVNWLVLNNFQSHAIYGQAPYLISSCGQDQTILDQITTLRSDSFPGLSMFQSNYLTESGYIPASCGILTEITNYFGSDVSPNYPSAMVSSSDPSSVSYWKFDESSGSAAADSTDGNNGTWSGSGSHFVSGRVYNAAYFNGTDDVVSIGNPGNLNSTSEGTVSAWVRVNSWTLNEAPIVVKAANDDNKQKDWAIMVGGNSTSPSIKFFISSGSGYNLGTNFAQYFYSNIFYNTWYHVTLTWQRTDKTYMYSYVNGHLSNTTSMTDNMGASKSINVGKYSNQSSYFNGNVDELRIYNKFLTPTQVLSNYQQELLKMGDEATSPITVTINQAAGQSDPTSASPINFAVVFSESVSDFATGDITLSGSAGATTAIVTGSGTTYNVAVSGMTGSGTVIASLSAGVAHNGVGISNEASTSTDHTVTYNAPSFYYVSTTGNDSAPGTLAQPWKTIQRGVNALAAGNTLYIRGGTYTDGLITIKNSGSAGAYITLTNYNNENVIIDDTWLSAADRNWDSSLNQPAAMIHIVGKSYIKISGLNLINQPPTVYCNNPPQLPSSNCIDGDANKGFSIRYGIRIISQYTSAAHEQSDDWVDSIDSPADHIIIENNHIEETKSAAIAAWTGATNITIDGNTVVNGQNDHANGTTSSDQEVVDICEASDFEIKNNHVSYNGRLDNHGNPFWGVGGGILVAVKGGRHLNMDVENGSIHDNTITGDPIEGGIYLDGEKTLVSNVDIYNNNFFYSNGVHIAAECGGTVSDVRIFNNVIDYSGQYAIGVSTTNTCYDSFYLSLHPAPPGNGLKKNIYILNNTIFGTFFDGGRGIWITTSDIENIQVKNNIVAFVPVSQNDILKAYHTPEGYPPYYAIYTAQITRLKNDSMGYSIPANQIISSNNLIVNKAIYPPLSALTTCDTCSEVDLPGSTAANPQFITSTIGVHSKDELPLDYTEGYSDLHLQSNSPAIDTGSSSSAPAYDYDGISRPQGAGYDIGAYEYAGSFPTPLTVTINQAVGQVDPTSSPSINFTVVFSDTVSDFATGDVSLTGSAGATTGTVSGSGTTYNVAVSGMTGSGTVITSLSAGVAHDGEGTGNDLSTSTDHTVTYSMPSSYPVLTSITISDTSGYTNDSTPTITIVSSSSPTYVAFSCNGGGNWSSWISYSDTISSFDITNGATGCSSTNGSKTITAKLKNVSNNESTSKNDTTYYDNTGPTGSIANASGNPTSDSTPTLNLTIADTGVGISGAQMHFSCDNSTWSTWESYSTPKSDFNIKPGSPAYGCGSSDGSRTVYAQFRDSLLNVGISYNTGGFTLDTLAPTVTINQSAGQSDPTSAPSINFTVVFSDTVSDFATGDVSLTGSAGATTGTVSGSGTTYNVAVSGMTGSGTVITSLSAGVAHDAAGNASEASTSSDHTVTYNAPSSGPTLTSITISDTSGYTNDSTPTITIVSSSSPTYVAFSCNGGGNWSSWISYSDTISSFDITNGATGCSSTNGSKTITAKLKNVSNNESTSKNDTTYYDNTGPTGSIANASGNPTSDSTPTLNLTIADTGVGISGAQMHFSCDNSTWSTWESYSTPKNNFSIKPGVTTYGCGTSDGARTVYVKYRDSLQNVGSSYNSGSFTLDTSLPPSSEPVISLVTATTTNSTATVEWATDVSASSKVEYGKTTSYGSSSPETDTPIGVASHTVSISSLSKCTTYHYRVRSTDISLNETVSSDHTFKTTGCSSGSSHHSSSSSSHRTSSSSSSSKEGAITLTKINSVNIYPVVVATTSFWNNYYSASATPWFYGAGVTNGVNVTVLTWPNITVCKTIVSGGVWGCVPTTPMASKIHRIDIKYGSKFLPAFNLRIGYGYTPAVPAPTYRPITTNTPATTNTVKPVAPIIQNTPSTTVFGKIINQGTIKGTSSQSEGTGINLFEKIINFFKQILKWLGIIKSDI